MADTKYPSTRAVVRRRIADMTVDEINAQIDRWTRIADSIDSIRESFDAIEMLVLWENHLARKVNTIH